MIGIHRVLPTLFWITTSVSVSILAGCGGVKMHPVSGTIKYPDGTPMPGEGTIIFNSLDLNAKGNPRGAIKEDGSFRIGTFDEADGAPEGKYRIAIMPTTPRNPNKPPPGWPPIDRKYMSHDKSGLEVTVTPGKNELKLVVDK